MSLRYPLGALILAGLFLVGISTRTEAAEKKTTKPFFGVLQAPTPEAARAQAEAWLKAAGKTDPATTKAFQAIWDQADRSVLDRVSETLTLGNPDAAKLLSEARDPAVPAPKEVPAQLKDAKLPTFYRANLALAYGKSLSNRRVYEEALDALKAVKVEQVVDPGVFLFHRAVAEHALLQKEEATRSIVRLIDDVDDAPDRYKLVATLMYLDMQTWRDKDLGWIARKMDNIERRLELARGGKQTQKIQKEVVARLDELIKQMENQAKGCSQCNGGACPGGQPQPGNGQGTNQPNQPMQDSQIANNSGPGKVDEKKLKELAEVWGKLPEKKRAEAMMELTRDMPARYRDVIENYFKKLAQVQAQP